MKLKCVFNIFPFILLLSTCLFFACNYGFKGSSPPEGIKTIFIPTFEDQSGFGSATLREDFTLLLKNKFINDNTLEYADKVIADGMISCVIKSVQDEPLVVSGGEQVSKRKLTINVSVDFQNLKKKKNIWIKDFSNWGEYDSSSGGFSKRDEGIKVAMDKITNDIVLEVTSNW
ncbi:MAG: LPS assembly lipoprotein LptE [Ignavibacteria bacterium]